MKMKTILIIILLFIPYVAQADMLKIDNIIAEDIKHVELRPPEFFNGEYP